MSSRHAALGIREDVMIVEAEGWRTPLTGVMGRRGSVRLAQTHYRGVYHAEGLDGAKWMYVPNWLPVTVLQERRDGWQDWMVDDPLHWLGMRRTVAHLPSGRIVCAGLGLGLMLHHIVNDRPDITEVRVIEKNPDVIDLITPTLPADPRFTIVEADFYKYTQQRADAAFDTPGEPDGVLWDLAVGDGNSPEVQKGFIMARAYVHGYWPGAELVIFGDQARLAAVSRG
jgi:hypothetical protein